MSRNSVFFLVVAGALFSLPAVAEETLLERVDIRDRLSREITRLDLSASLSLIDTEIIEGLGVAGGYRYEVEPAYLDGVYTRVDKWKLDASFKAGEIIEELGSPFFLGLNKGAEIIFVRHYKSQAKAIFSAPTLDPRKIPFSADLAKKHLRPGESVILPVNLNLFAGIQGSSYSEFLKGVVGSRYLLSGRFHLQVLKIDESKVRLRLVAQRGFGRQIYGKVESDFDLFGISLLDKVAEKIIFDDLIKADHNRSKGILFIADYLFDLSNEDASEAYDQIMSTGFKLKDIEVINPFLSGNELSKRYVNDLSLAEKLTHEDKHLPQEDRRVRRVLQGLNQYDSESDGFTIGLEFARLKTNRSFTRNKIKFLGASGSEFNDGESNYLYPTEHSRSETKLFWGLYREKSSHNRSILYDLDLESERFTNYVITQEETDKRMTARERRRLLLELERSLPKELFDRLDLSFFRIPGALSNARVYSQIVFHKDAFLSLKGLSEEELRALFDQYIKANHFEEALNELQQISTAARGIRAGSHRERKIQRTVDYVSPFIAVFSEIVNTDLTLLDTSEGFKSFVELRSNPVFKQFSTGYFMSLIQAENLTESVFLRLRTDSLETTSKTQVIGDEEQLDTLLAMEYIQNVIRNGAFDLRLETFGTPIRTID